MALTKFITQEIPSPLSSVLGLSSEKTELYIKIKRYSGEEDTCNFVVRYFNRITVFDEEKSTDIIELIPLNIPEIIYSFIVSEDGSENDFNVRKQAYEYLKTLPEFAGCEDC